MERAEMTKDRHIKVLGMLHIARGGLVLLIGILGFIFFAGIGLFSGDETALGILGVIGTLAIIVMGLLAIPSILAGIGLLNRQEWGRILALIIGFLSLVDFPLGTALGIYTIWVLFDGETMNLFKSEFHAAPVSAPPGSQP
jgi:hypothetical protein